jgi:hypothetical protein
MTYGVSPGRGHDCFSGIFLVVARLCRRAGGVLLQRPQPTRRRQVKTDPERRGLDADEWWLII